MPRKARRDMTADERAQDNLHKAAQRRRRRDRECIAEHGITLDQMADVKRLFRDLKAAVKASRPVRVKLSPEERAERKRAAARNRYENLSPEQREKLREYKRSRTKSDTEIQRTRESARRRYESRTAEQVERERAADRERWRRNYQPVPRVKLTEEERRARANAAARARYAERGEEMRAAAREWKAAHPEEVRANRKYHRHRRRLAELDSDLTRADVAHLVASASVCPCCGVRMVGEPGPAQKQLDHIIPLNVGGTHTLANVRVICRTCNLRRPKDGSDLEGFQPALWSVSVGAPVFG